MSLFENLTYEDILTRVLGRMDNTVLQTREGSYAYDQAAPMCMELWMLYATLQELVSAFYIDQYSGKYLDDHARLFAMHRREGTKAACSIALRGRDGLTVPAGTAFYTEDGLEFGLSADVTLAGGAGEGLLRAAKVGDAYNLPAGSVTQVLRSVRGLDSFETDANGNAWAYEYDADGRMTQKTDAMGRKTAYEYDNVGNLVKQTDALGGVTKWAYDKNGNLTSTTDPNKNTTSYTYDKLGRVRTATDPNGGVVSAEYDKNGNIVKVTDAEKNVTTFVPMTPSTV